LLWGFVFAKRFKELHIGQRGLVPAEICAKTTPIGIGDLHAFEARIGLAEWFKDQPLEQVVARRQVGGEVLVRVAHINAVNEDDGHGCISF
jgi:hypothetical protein